MSKIYITGMVVASIFLLFLGRLAAQNKEIKQFTPISMAPFSDGRNHWYGIRDAGNIVNPVPNQPTYPESDILNIADNILIYQRNNGGWPKNYDMQAILTKAQRDSLLQTKDQQHTTFDNSTTYTHVEYLAQVCLQSPEIKYREACLKGLRFMLKAQYPNGGWPQYFPLETKNYSRHITFNDGAFLGVMGTMKKIKDHDPMFSFLGDDLRKEATIAFDKGLECILKTQIISRGRLTAWCQQHDEITLKPAWARAYEMPSICNGESVPIVLFLMGFDHPEPQIVNAVQSAVKWFNESTIYNTRVKTIKVAPEESQWRTNTTDRVVVTDSTAPPIWTRFYELETERPLFSDRNSKMLYSLAEVGRERRSGYGWYTYAPQEVLKKYPEWQKKWAPNNNVLDKNSAALASQLSEQKPIPRDTSYTPYQTWLKIKKEFPQAKIVVPVLPKEVKADYDVVYTTLYQTPFGKRDLHLDLFRPARKGKYPALLLIHGGGWRAGNKSMQRPLAQKIAAQGFVTAAVEYRLSPEALYPAAIFDIKAAIRFLRAHAKQFQLNPDKIAISGSSAGGQLAALIGMTAGVEKFEGTEGYENFTSKVQAIIDMDGILDFRDPNESGKDLDPSKPSAGAYWFGGSYKQLPEKWTEASPVEYAGRDSPPILFINSALPRFHAGRDSVISILNRHHIYSEVHTIPDTPHPFWLFDPWFEPTVGYMVGFLKKTLKSN